MIEEQAVVVRVEQDQAFLEIVRKTPCGLCGQTRGCGVSLWGRLFGHHQSVFRANNGIDARIGDHVVVGVEEKALLASSLTVYGVPLVALIVGTMMGGWLAPSALNKDLHAVLGASAGLMLGLFWLKGNATGRSIDPHYSPVILRHATESDLKGACRPA